MPIDINTLAPWVAIAVTLILSILVPLFTQIANNRFQLKKAKQDRKFEEERDRLAKKTAAYEQFLTDVGGTIAWRTKENVHQAGSSIGRIYLYVPVDWYTKLNELHHSLHDAEWGKAEKQYAELAKMVAEEYQKIEPETKKKK